MSTNPADAVSVAACIACVAFIVLFQYLVSARLSTETHNGIARRGDLHLQRKVQHMGTGAMIYVASRYFGRRAGCLVLLLFAALFYGLHKLRGCNKAIDTAYIKCFRNILRQYEVSRTVLPGAYYFLLGSGLSLRLFSFRVARLAILHLSVGDPAAAFFGTLYGRHKFVKYIGKLGGKKSVEGSIGGGILAFASTISLAAGTAAAAAELLDIGGWDDNITLPLLSGVFLQVTVGNLLN
ncbi:Predicted ER membrane protein [Plasmopara halstedii]|uniref:Predicted ER membrane protein n=1 Tax=Plasmopara halstedii TaxID=4781 RepID=A0A0N7L3L7_PLAHL|nr:Predicted ER membrane protein [Plasmopara halstedii]CEG36227.1 Predicted ER membrane protein [Plasmopara halstedii]|eukprot:XP_024572596.1 Predicted ER membrane protein [Plasmopara halstedii]